MGDTARWPRYMHGRISISNMSDTSCDFAESRWWPSALLQHRFGDQAVTEVFLLDNKYRVRETRYTARSDIGGSSVIGALSGII